MLQFNSAKHKLAFLFLMFIFAGITGHSQKIQRPQPDWWFGVSGAANFNFYRGTTQVLNNSVTVPAAFHKGNGVKPYLSVLTEYRPNKVWGGMLNVAFDNRGSKFDGVMAPCNCPASLSTKVSYLAIEPSIRLAPFASAFYIFAGPTLGINLSKSFLYTQEKQTDKSGDWSEMRKTVFSGQAGAGIDIPISARTSSTQVTLSPFASFQTDFGHEPRSVESWSFYTYRAGIAIKIGKSKKSTPKITKAEPESTPLVAKAEPIEPPAIISEKDVSFSVRVPLVVPTNRKVNETFPLRNSVFFDQGSTTIPNRYVKLNKTDAASFKEQQLQQAQPDNLNYGRSSRQMAVYHNILNILGDRMRTHPQSTVVLTGASDKNPAEGKMLAENIRQYLITAFEINASRISVEGRDKPLIPSEQPGAIKDLELLREGDRRVDITSSSSALMMQVGGNTPDLLNPVQMTAIQDDPLDSDVVFNAGGASDLLQNWSVDVTDEDGVVHYFGPYTKDQVSVTAKTLLGNNKEGKYKILMHGETKSGKVIKKESSFSLTKTDDPKQEGLRYSILFDFDKSKSITSYEKFLTDIVTPLITDNSTVIIHGHTDIIGDEKYNIGLANDRAKGAQQIIEHALIGKGKKGVKFETYGFGEDLAKAPFENNLPEERFYNRTVIIDIVK